MTGSPDQLAFLERLQTVLPAIARDADREDGFPRDGFASLRAAGVLMAALPAGLAGLDFGCARQGRPSAAFFRRLGQASISLGRLVEGHVNALRLVHLYGTAGQVAAAAAAAGDGALIGLWVTDGERPVTVQDGRLGGGKAFCSGAGHAALALVTAQSGDGTALHLVDVAGITPANARTMTGVRGAVTADMALDGVAAGAPIGQPGDYLRQPEFSAGAWRGSAIACGGLEALSREAVTTLVGRGRHHNPHQAARIGRLLIARDTAIHWVDRAAVAADGNDPGEVAATVNLARIAVEQACLDAIVLVQRSIGLGALLAGTRIERLVRDLMTYLRQPAPDETLTEAATWFAERTA